MIYRAVDETASNLNVSDRNTTSDLVELVNLQPINLFGG